MSCEEYRTQRAFNTKTRLYRGGASSRSIEGRPVLLLSSAEPVTRRGRNCSNALQATLSLFQRLPRCLMPAANRRWVLHDRTDGVA